MPLPLQAPGLVPLVPLPVLVVSGLGATATASNPIRIICFAMHLDGTARGSREGSHHIQVSYGTQGEKQYNGPSSKNIMSLADL